MDTSLQSTNLTTFDARSGAKSSSTSPKITSGNNAGCFRSKNISPENKNLF